MALGVHPDPEDGPFSTLSAEYCPVSGGKVWPEGNGKEAETLCTFL